jgi:hypothetical protein
MGRKFECLLEEVLGEGRFTDRKVVDWPFTEGRKVGLRLLSEEEYSDCDTRARKWARDLGLEVGLGRNSELEFRSRFAAELLTLALTHPTSAQPLVSSPDQLRSRITRAELDTLLGAYNDFAEEMAPVPSQLESDKEFEELSRSLLGPFEETCLSRCAPSTLRRLAHWHASKLAAMRKSDASFGGGS